MAESTPDEAKPPHVRIDSQPPMTEQEFIEKCLSDFMSGWVPVDRYLQLYPEETAGKIQGRVKQGRWQRGVEYACPKGSRPWINLPAVRRWLEADRPKPGRPPKPWKGETEE